MTLRHGSVWRLAILAIVIGALAGDGGGVRAQTDGVAQLLRQLEQVVLSGDPGAHEALLAESADRNGARLFASTQFPRGLTHVAIQERDRQPLAGTLPGNGYQLVVDAFEQAGGRARVGTWQIDVKRLGGVSAEGEWRIAGEQPLSSVEALYKLSLSPGKEFAVRNLTVSADDLTLAFPDGFAFVAETDQGVVAMVLVSRGDMRFRPAPEAERGQVKIFSGAEALETKFDAVYLRMSPGDFEALLTLKQIVPSTVDAREFKRADDVFREELPKSYGVDLGDLSRDPWSLLPAPGDVLAEVRTRRFDTLTYTRASSEPEDISLFDRKRRHNIALYASERKLAERGPSYSDNDSSGFDVLDYNIDVNSSPDQDWIDGTASLKLRVRAPSINSLWLHLAASLAVQSVVSSEYGRLFAMRAKDQDSLVVNLPASVARGTNLSLTISYGGRLKPQKPDRETAALQAQRFGPVGPDIVLTPEPSSLYTSGSSWYPQPSGADYATATMRITVPGDLECVASGTLSEGSPTLVAARDSSPATRTYLFHATQPLRYLSFVVGRFVRGPQKMIDLPSGGSANARSEGVWYSHLDLSAYSHPRESGRGAEFVDRAGDIATFYHSILGDVPFPSLTVALLEDDLPGGHSPGYFAIVNQVLPGSDRSWRSDPSVFSNYPDFFLAHEIAHQWWGQAVGWRNYHEQWLSEGFAQYFAALYAQRERGDEVFAAIMRQMRRSAVDDSAQGPVSLGYRLGHIRGDSRVFRAVVYNKGAVVLHMLRRLMGDEAFFRGVRRFYLVSRFKAVGTDDLRAAMEAESDRPLERFFERWINGARLPRIKFSYRVDGGDIVVHVEQIDEVFDFPLAVTLQYADRKPVDVSVPVTEKIVDVRLPLAGTLRSAEISRTDAPLAEVVRN